VPAAEVERGEDKVSGIGSVLEERGDMSLRAVQASNVV
jgi:hypothetical protein